MNPRTILDNVSLREQNERQRLELCDQHDRLRDCRNLILMLMVCVLLAMAWVGYEAHQKSSARAERDGLRRANAMLLEASILAQSALPTVTRTNWVDVTRYRTREIDLGSANGGAK